MIYVWSISLTISILGVITVFFICNFFQQRENYRREMESKEAPEINMYNTLRDR